MGLTSTSTCLRALLEEEGVRLTKAEQENPRAGRDAAVPRGAVGQGQSSAPEEDFPHPTAAEKVSPPPPEMTAGLKSPGAHLGSECP